LLVLMPGFEYDYYTENKLNDEYRERNNRLKRNFNRYQYWFVYCNKIRASRSLLFQPAVRLLPVV